MSQEFRKTIPVQAPLQTIWDVLVDASRMADWNPAISSLLTTETVGVVGDAYATRVRGMIPATFRYVKISPTVVEHDLSFVGFDEHAVWELEQREGGSTLVTHRFRQTGPVARLVPAEASDVVSLRLDRLRRRVEASMG